MQNDEMNNDQLNEQLNDKNELSDIVLDKGNSAGSNKKILLAVATLGVVLIVVVLLMNSLNSDGTQNLPQAVLPPQPQQTQVAQTTQEEPLFEEVEVIQDDTPAMEEDNLDKIAQKLKQQSNEITQEDETLFDEEPQKVVQKTVTKPKPHKTVTHTKKTVTKTNKTTKTKVATHGYYVQVGSFARYEPNKKFLHKITSLGYHYKYHKVNKMNKVLVGPFSTRAEANKAKKVLRAKVVAGAFVTKI